jgi:Holliday junction resolvase YEN1
VLLSYTNPIISATDAGARRTHTPPRWECEPDLAKMAHLCELHFEWGLKDIIIKRFRTVLWPSIVLRALRRSALETDMNALCQPPCTPTRERESHQDSLGTPSKLLARHFSSMALEADGEESEGSGLRDLIVKIHSSRTHAYTDGILEYRLEIAPAPLVRLASAGIQGLRKPADTTYDVLPSESDDSDDGDDEDGCGGTGKRKKRRGGGPPPEPESHVRVWMPACMVRIALPDLIERYEAALEAKRAKKSRPKAPKGTAQAPATRGKRKATLPPRKATEVPPVPPDAEYFDLDVSSTSEESGGQASPLPSRNHSRPLPARNDPLRSVHSKTPSAVMVRKVDDVFANFDTFPEDGAHQHSACSQESPRRRLDVISGDRENDSAPGPSDSPIHHISSPSKVLQRLDLNLVPGINISSKARLPIAPVTPPSNPPRGLQPFPIAFEDEEEFSDGDHNPSGPSLISDGQNYLRYAIPTTPSASSPSRPRPQWSPVTLGGEESSDDMDAVPGELPALHVAPREQPCILADSHMPRDGSPSPERVSSGLKRHARPPEQPSPSKARRNAQREPRPAARSPSRPSDRSLARVAETSIISISSDSDNGGDEDDDDGLSPAAPLLIARSRSTVSRPLDMASAAVSSSQGDLEHEVIDLT